MVLHRDLTGADLHEPKGVASASAETLYHADGAGSGTWKKAEAANVTVADTNNYFTGTDVEAVLDELYSTVVPIDGKFDDVSTASTILLPVPFSCVVESIKFILGGTITTANAVITVTRSDGAAMGSQTITASGSAEGTVFNLTPSGNASLTVPTHNYIKLVSDGGSTGAQPLYVQARVRRV